MFNTDINTQALEEAKKEIPGPVATVCDNSKRAEIEAMMTAAVKALGGLDVLVNNPATFPDAERIRFAVLQNRESLNLYDIEDFRKNRFETIALLDQPCQRQSAPIFAVCQNHAGMFRRKT